MKDIKGYEGFYSITRDGQIWTHSRSWKRHGFGSLIKRRGKFRKLRFNINGYPEIILFKGKGLNKVSKHYLVHRLVAMTFINNPLNLPQINHRDGVKTNNRVENLEWCTAKQNVIHSYKTGLKKGLQGEKCHTAKISGKQVIDIRKMSGKFTQQDIADKFGLSQSTIWEIIHRKIWKHI